MLIRCSKSGLVDSCVENSNGLSFFALHLPVERRPSTNERHSASSQAIRPSEPHECPSLRISASTSLLLVNPGFPRNLFPRELQVTLCMAIQSWSLHSVSSTNFHFLLFGSSSTGVSFVRYHILWFEIVSSQWIRRMLLRRLFRINQSIKLL